MHTAWFYVWLQIKDYNCYRPNNKIYRITINYKNDPNMSLNKGRYSWSVNPLNL